MTQDNHKASYTLHNYGIYADREWSLNWKRNGEGNCVPKSIKALRLLSEDPVNYEDHNSSSHTPLNVLKGQLRKLQDDLRSFFISEKPYPFDTTTWQWAWLMSGYRNSLRETEEAFDYLGESRFRALVIGDKDVLKKKLLRLAEDLEVTRACLLNVEQPFVARTLGQVSFSAEDLPTNSSIDDLIAYAKDVEAQQAASRAKLTLQRSIQRGAASASGGSGGKGSPSGLTIVVTAGGEGGTHTGGGGNGGQLTAVRGGAGGTSQANAGGCSVGVGGYGFVRGGVTHFEPDGVSRLRKAAQLGKNGTARYNNAITTALDALKDSDLKGETEALRDIQALLLPVPD